MFYPALLGGAQDWLTGTTFGMLVTLVVGWAAAKWLIPLLKTEFQKKLAEYILVIADEVTDWLVAKYPEKDIYRYLDAAVDKIMEVCGVKREVAERAAMAAMARKGITEKK